jgi:AcrR family transcriptional regulator
METVSKSVASPPQRLSPTRKFHQRKDTIVRAAVDLLNQKGVRGMTLADVAQKLDLVPTAVMYYFRRKEDLAAACYFKSIEIYEALIAEADRGKTAREALGIFVRGFFDLRRRISVGEADEVANFNDARALRDPALGTAFIGMFRNLRGLLLKPEGLGEMERVALNARTHLLLTELLWVVAWAQRYDPEDYARLADQMLDILENGLASNRQSPAPHALLTLEPPEADKSSTSRETFLRAATTLMNEQGYLGASVQKISQRLNVTKGAFYHHHTGKDDLVSACFARTFDIMRRAQREAADVTGTGCEHLVAVAAALLEYQLSNNAPLLRNSALTSVPERICHELLAEFDRISRRYALVFSDGIADGSLRPVDSAIAAQMITAMINASAELQMWVPDVTAGTVNRLFARPLFEGLLRT